MRSILVMGSELTLNGFSQDLHAFKFPPSACEFNDILPKLFISHINNDDKVL